MQPKGGVTLIIAVGGGKPPHHGHSNSKEKGCEMIKVPMEALMGQGEDGSDLVPEVGDSVLMPEVSGEVAEVNDDGTVHLSLISANGVPIEYVDHKEAEEVAEGNDDLEAAELLAAAEEEDEKMGY